MLVQVDGKDSASVVDALVWQTRHLPDSMMSSLTWDRGTEFAQHKRFTVATDVDVYFFDPRSPWQRGSNENTNGLLRQYLPKGADLSAYSQADLDAVALKLNTRPRKTLGFQMPGATLGPSREQPLFLDCFKPLKKETLLSASHSGYIRMVP